MVWPTLGSRKAKEQNRTEQNLEFCLTYRKRVGKLVEVLVNRWIDKRQDGNVKDVDYLVLKAKDKNYFG